MKKPNLLRLSILFIIVAAFATSEQLFSQSEIPGPEEHFGFVPGSDRMLFTYEQLIDYLVKLDKASPMLKLVENGHSPMGRKMYIAFISSEKNINNLERLRKINRELALNPDLSWSRYSNS